MEQPQFYRPVI